MSPEKNEPNEEEEPLLRIVQALHNGTMTGKMLTQDVRREVVDFLRLQGLSLARIADILGLSDRTIKRDIDELKKKNAFKLRPTFASEMAGELLRKAGQHWQTLKSISSNQLSTTNERILAEKTAWEIEIGLCRELREMGYLPSAPKAIVGQFSHQVNVNADNSWEDLFQQYSQLKEMLVDRNGVIDVEVQRTLDVIEPTIHDGMARQKTQEALRKAQEKFQEDQNGQE